MSLIDSLNVTRVHQTYTEQDDSDKLVWELSEVDLNHIFPATALILKRQGLSLVETQVPNNVYSSTPLVIPRSIHDSCSEDVGNYLLLRFLQKEKLFGLNRVELTKDKLLQGPADLNSPARRSKEIILSISVS